MFSELAFCPEQGAKTMWQHFVLSDSELVQVSTHLRTQRSAATGANFVALVLQTRDKG